MILTGWIVADLARPSLSEISSIIDSVGTRESALLKRYTDHISALALNSNCYIQLSVADAQAKGTDTDDALRVYLTIIFEAFGSRMLFADCHQPQWAQTCTRILSSIGAQQDGLSLFERPFPCSFRLNLRRRSRMHLREERLQDLQTVMSR